MKYTQEEVHQEEQLSIVFKLGKINFDYISLEFIDLDLMQAKIEEV
jgi:hypothetical protein